MIKMCINSLIIVLICFIVSVQSDISHLDNSILSHFNHLYGVPVFATSTTTRPFLPEIVINRAAEGNINGYVYTYVPPSDYININGDNDRPSNQYLPPTSLSTTSFPLPPLNDEIPILPPNQSYLPPSIPTDEVHRDDGYNYNKPATSTTTQRPIIVESDVTIGDSAPHGPGYIYSTPGTMYLPPSLERSPKEFDPRRPIRLHINEMRCIQTQDGHFRTMFTVETSLDANPVLDTIANDPRCDIHAVRSRFIIEIATDNFKRCGVWKCDDNLCLRVRFPHIHGMQTDLDSILTLKCKIQERIVHKIHSVRMGASNEGQARSIGAYVNGGSQQPFKTQVALLRKSENGFTRNLEQHGTVLLGEELMLRAHVRAGDGWNYTRLSDVQLQRFSPSGEIVNAAVLINSDGCVNHSMRSICPAPPVFEPPLGHRLIFKAVMFQGMKSGEEIQMSIKISGCLEKRDCSAVATSCDGNLKRLKRNAETNSTEFSEIAVISFHVTALDHHGKTLDVGHKDAYFAIGGCIGLICILGIILAILYKYRK